MSDNTPTPLEHLKLGFALIVWGLIAWLTALASDEIREWYADRFISFLDGEGK